MPTLHSHTHCQATQTNAVTKAWQRVCLSNRTTKTTDKPTDENNTEAITIVWQNGGFSAKLKVSALKSATSPRCKTLHTCVFFNSKAHSTGQKRSF